MKKGILLSLLFILLSGCVATMKEAYVPTKDLNVKWLGRDSDKVGIGTVDGDGDLDGHFQIELD